MDVLYTNQDKILELTKIKGYVQLVNEEERNIKKEIVKEIPPNRKNEGVNGSPESNSDNKKS